MNALKKKLAAFQRSRAGLFVQKVMDDQSPNLAALLAWGTLSALLPLILGILGLAGLVLRDPQRLDQVYNTLLYLLPQEATGPFGQALQSVRHEAAGKVGIVAVLLLLFNGSRFFSNMASVFNQAYHVQGRNLIMNNVVAILMLIITTALLIVSTLALGLGSVLDNLPVALPFGPVLGRVITWSISILSAILLFLLLYKVLPNASQGWRDVIPGTLVSAVLFFVILLVFPIYVALFPPNQAYAVFGVFLVFTFFLYLLGFVFVLGAELNAFLQEPARSTALAQATQQAQQGKAEYAQPPGEVRAEARGKAPAISGGSPLAPRRSAASQMSEQGQAAPTTEQAPAGAPRPSLAGKLLGFVALIAAVVLLRKREASPSA